MDPNEMIETHCDLEDLSNSLGSYPKPFQKAFKDACLLQKYTVGCQFQQMSKCFDRIMENLESQAWHPGLSSDEPYDNTYELHLQTMKKAYCDIKIDLDQNPKLHFEVVTATSDAGRLQCDELQLSTTLKPPTLEHGISIHGEESVTRSDPWLCNDAFASPPPLAFECSSPVSVASTALDLPVLQENNAWDRFQISSAPKSLAPEHPELTEEDKSMQSTDLWQYDDFITLPGEQGAEPEPTFDSFECSIASNDGLCKSTLSLIPPVPKANTS